MNIVPAKLLRVRVANVSVAATWTTDDGTGDPFIGAPYQWTVTLMVTPQSHSSHTTRVPFSYAGLDIAVGDWVSNQTGGFAWQIISLTSANESTVVCVVEDVDRYNTFSNTNQSGDGSLPALLDGFVFQTGDDGLPILLPVIPYVLDGQWQTDLISRFRHRNILRSYYRVSQVGHGFSIGDLIALTSTGSYVKASPSNSTIIGVVHDSNVPSANQFTYRPIGPVITGISPTLPGSPGDLIYLDPITAGAYTNVAPRLDPKPVYIRLGSGSQGILLDRGSPGTGHFQQTATGAVARTVQEKLSEIVSVADFGAVGDGVADDTLAISNAIAAACLRNGGVYFPVGLYLTGPQTIGATGSYNSCAILGESMYAQYGDTVAAVGKGSIIKLKAGSNNHLFTVPPANSADVGPAPPLFSNVWLDGNRANQNGGQYWLVDLPTHTATANKCRSAYFDRVRGSNAYGGVRVGGLRNAGRMSGVAILGTTGPALQLGSCNDWRIIDGDLWSTGGPSYYGTGGGSVIFTATNFFSSGTHGVKIDATATDHTFYGCSFDRNQLNGIIVLGTTWPVTLVGCRFTLNGQNADATYADAVSDGGNRLHLIGCQFECGSLTNRPKYCVETKNGATAVVVANSHIAASTAGRLPFALHFTNDTSAVVQTGDSITAKNFFIDYDEDAVNRVRVKGGQAFNSAILGVDGEANAGLRLYAEGVGEMVVGRDTNKLLFYGAGTPRAKQTVVGSRASGEALAALLTALANLGLIIDGSSP